MRLFGAVRRVISIRKTFKFLVTVSVVSLLMNLSLVDEVMLPLKHYVATAGPNLIANQLFMFKYFSVEECPLVSPRLIGLTKVFVNEDPLMMKLVKDLSYTVKTGGKYEPTECRTRYNLAVVVPFRDREAHLTAFLANFHPFLQRQQLAYTIFIVEQTNSSVFNRGALMNVGYVEALKTNQTFDCFYFHDVDLVPEDDRHTYACPEAGKPRHMAVLVSSFNYTSIYPGHFGGVTAMSTGDFKIINGFSNSYWGWGGEDDDLLLRVKAKNLTVTYHQPQSEARYTMLSHKTADKNPQRFTILFAAAKRFATDGLTDLQYNRLDVQLQPLYTRIKVDIKPKS